MTTLVQCRRPLVAAALVLARTWCAGHIIDGAPALAHAVRVAGKLGDHLPDAPPELVAAVLLHDAPYFAPADVDLDTVLTGQLGAEVTRIVRAIEREHTALASDVDPDLPVDDVHTLAASAADKIVSIGAIVRRGQAAPEPALYWQTRAAFVRRVPYFHAFARVAAPHLPATMATELGAVIDLAGRAASAATHRR